MTPFPARLKYWLGPSTQLELMPDCALLFSEHDQQIHRLNFSSAVVASRLETKATLEELTAELSSSGVESATAKSWVQAFLNQLADLGLLEAQVPSELMQVASSQHVRIAGIHLSIHYGTRELLQLVGGSFAHLEELAAPVSHTYHLAHARKCVLLSKDNAPARVFAQSMAAVRLKGFLLEDVLNSNLHLVALHAACLSRDDRAILLLGSPGAGKTTLSLALLKHGYRYGSDDVTLVTREGSVWGVSLAPAVKESAWELAELLGASLAGLPTHCRPDGQGVRFYEMAKESLAGPCPVRAIIRLNRVSGAEATLERLPSEEALGALFLESRSRDGRCSAEIMHCLVKLVREADCFDLSYSEASDGARVLREYDCD